MLKSVYDELVVGGKKKKSHADANGNKGNGRNEEKTEKLACPATGRTSKEKNTTRLVFGRSGFAAENLLLEMHRS